MRSKQGEQLAKILWYYNLIPNANVAKEKIVCPFHEDVNPSMAVDLEQGSFYCFGCQAKGGPEKFVELFEKKYHNLNELKSLKVFHDILKSNKVSDLKLSKNVKKHKKAKKELYVQAYDYYYGLRTIEWPPDAHTELLVKEAYNYMKSRGFTSKALNKVKAKYTYNDNYPLIFPMLDNGKFKGWVCRTNDKELAKKRKYLYNEGFLRATTLVGDYGAKDYVIVVEGYMDRLKFIQYGYNNVVAILGWKMTLEQIDKLKKKGITTIISALDNDECGKKGTKYLQTHFNVIRWSYLKELKDTGDMSKAQFDKMFRKTMLKLKQMEVN